MKTTIFQCQDKNNSFGAEVISCLKFEVMTGMMRETKCSVYVCASQNSRTDTLQGVERLLMNDTNSNIKDIKVPFNNLGKNKGRSISLTFWHWQPMLHDRVSLACVFCHYFLWKLYVPKFPGPGLNNPNSHLRYFAGKTH